MSKHVSWTEIESFYNVRKSIAKWPELLCDRSSRITYRAKVKLHGTNAAVRIDHDGTVTAFSRTNVITPENDNAGFAAWVRASHHVWSLRRHDHRDLVVYGEWCGPGIQKGVAINNINEKVFAIFAERHLDPTTGEDVMFSADPATLGFYAEGFLGKCVIERCHVIPWFNNGEQFVLDVAAPAEEIQETLDLINDRVAAVEACDPWVKEIFGVEGTGEGLVFYPVDELDDYRFFKNVCFKAKGEKHKVVAKTKPVQADPTVAANTDAFVELVVTPARLEQGARAVANGELVFDQAHIGEFMKWMNTDLHKETQLELEASGLDAKTAYRACSNRARDWYLANARKV